MTVFYLQLEDSKQEAEGAEAGCQASWYIESKIVAVGSE